MDLVLMKGNDALGEGAINAGCRHFFGYPITPQSELMHYLAVRLPEVGGTFLQAESEIAAINMVYGAASAGAMCMTASSGPGISLIQEGLSYLAGAELPCVVVNIMRGGPGLGNIAPSQADYFQATRGGGHGDYRLIVLAPNSVQEIYETVPKAFYLADLYRNPVMILADGIMGQMIEPVRRDINAESTSVTGKTWTANGTGNSRPKNKINSVYVIPEEMERHNIHLNSKYNGIMMREQAWEEYMTVDATLVLVAFGTASRICRAAVDRARDLGIPAGMIRPITLWPFPCGAFSSLVDQAVCFLVVEMNTGQMIDDVKISVGGNRPVIHFGRYGGMVPSVGEVTSRIIKMQEVYL